MNRLLPIGSVVRVAGEEDPLMVIGFYPEAEGRSYDYLAAQYPQGLFEIPVMSAFDEDLIEEVLFEGYQDELGAQALEAAKGYMDTIADANVKIAQAFAEYMREHPDTFGADGDDEPTSGYQLG